MTLSGMIRNKTKSRRYVAKSAEFRRILNLPRRSSYEDLTEATTEWLKLPKGTQMLRPVQAWAIGEMFEQGGLIASTTVGSGKTIPSHLCPVAMAQSPWATRNPLMMVRAGLLDKAERDRNRDLAPHWQQFPDLRIISYEMLSNINYESYLFDLCPDLIIMDEAQCIKGGSGRGKRVKRYMTEYPGTRIMALTGSLTRRSIKDYSDHAKWALKEKSPLPDSWMELSDWADALDENVDESSRCAPGALLDFCQNGEEPRLGYRRRFVESPGVITTEEASVEAALIVKERPIEVPPRIVAAFDRLWKRWETPGGETVSTVLDWIRHSKELSCGFYNRFVWPNNQPNHEWLTARKNWRRFVHKTIKNSRAVTYDTELQVANACRDGSLSCPADEYQRWTEIKETASPRTEAVWIDDFMVDAILRWAERPDQEKPELQGIVWTEQIALMDRLRDRGLLCFAAGENEIEQATQTCAAAMAHQVGKNLQFAYSRNLFVTMPESAVDFEQRVGRTHRPGQAQEDVVVECFMHCRSLWHCYEKVLRQAEYIEKTTGQKQRINIATQDFQTSEEIVLHRALEQDPLWVHYSDDAPDDE